MKRIGDKSKLVSVHSAFFVTLKNGIDRLFKRVHTGDQLKLTIAEAIFISPKVHENLRSAPTHHAFQIKEENIRMNDSVRFLDVALSDVCDEYS
jgi:phosphotransferase system IIA component